LWYGFVWDDRLSIVTNNSLKSWKTLWGIWFGAWDPAASMYRPVTSTVIFFQYRLCGVHPFGYHLSSVLFHALVCALVYRLARQLCQERATAVLASLLFAVHPIHLEAVAYVSALAEPLAAAAILGGLISYLRYRREGQLKWLVATCLCQFAGLLTKETAVVLPVLLVALEFSFGKPETRTKAAIYPAIAGIGVAVLAYGTMRHLAYRGFIYNESKVPAPHMVLTWPGLLLFYLKHLVRPAPLSPFYDVDYVTSANRLFWLPLLALAALLAAAVCWWWRSSNRGLVAFGVLAMAAGIVPALDITVFQWREFAHDRFAYLSSVFFALLVAQLLSEAFGKEHRQGGKTSFPLVGTAGVLLAYLALALLVESPPWRNQLSLCYYAMKIAPGNVRPAFGFAIALEERGDLLQAEQVMERVLAIDPHPKDASAAIYLTHVRRLLGRIADAEAPLRQAISLEP
jgi:4-amino-4-deoxy-L-arabinose transferase-like glycosyltransferase